MYLPENLYAAAVESADPDRFSSYVRKLIESDLKGQAVGDPTSATALEDLCQAFVPAIGDELAAWAKEIGAPQPQLVTDLLNGLRFAIASAKLNELDLKPPFEFDFFPRDRIEKIAKVYDTARNAKERILQFREEGEAVAAELLARYEANQKELKSMRSRFEALVAKLEASVESEEDTEEAEREDDEPAAKPKRKPPDRVDWKEPRGDSKKDGTAPPVQPDDSEGNYILDAQ